MVANLYVLVASLAVTVLAAVALALAISGRRYANRLSAVTTQLRLVLERSQEGVLIFHPDGRIALMSPKAEEVLGVPRGSSYADVQQIYECFEPGGVIIPPEQWPTARALRRDFVQDHHILFRHKRTGQIGSRRITSAPGYAPDGSLQFILVIYSDDSDRRHLDEARSRLADIVDSCHDAIIGTDLDGIVTSWNRSAETIFGHTAQQMIGHSIRRLLPDDKTGEEDDILARIVRGETVANLDSVRLHREGRLIPVSLTISPIRDARGQILGASKISRDITHTRDLERRLQRSQKMEALGQLTGGIAHDFNNLLGIIIGSLEVLEAHLAPDAAALHHTRPALQAALRGADLVGRLLTFSSTEQLKPQPTLLQSLIPQMMDMAQRALGPQIAVSTDLDAFLQPVLVDPSGLETSLLNLIVNARDAMPTGGTLRIATSAVRHTSLPELASATRAGDSYACITLTDTGSGMTQETMEHAFEPFFTTKPRGKGTGLGLAMVYGFVSQSRGTVRIASTPGRGTAVSLYLPLATEDAARRLSPSAAQARSVAHATLLLVDDEPDLLDLSAGYLSRLGYQILTAQNGRAALDHLAQHPPVDMLVTDILMPGDIDGIELARQVAVLYPGVPVLYTSGHLAGPLHQQTVHLDPTRILQKPYRLTELATMIQAALTRAAEARLR